MLERTPEPVHLLPTDVVIRPSRRDECGPCRLFFPVRQNSARRKDLSAALPSRPVDVDHDPAGSVPGARSVLINWLPRRRRIIRRRVLMGQMMRRVIKMAPFHVGR